MMRMMPGDANTWAFHKISLNMAVGFLQGKKEDLSKMEASVFIT